MTTITGAINTATSIEQLNIFVMVGNSLFERTKQLVCSIAVFILKPLFALYEIVFGSDATRFSSLHTKTIARLNGIKSSVIFLRGNFFMLLDDHKDRLEVRSEKLQLLINSLSRKLKNLNNFKFSSTPAIQRQTKVVDVLKTEIKASKAQLIEVRIMKGELEKAAQLSFSQSLGLS